jgi:transposase, IS5 family
MMTHFRKRLGPDIINEVNEWSVMEEQKQDKENDDDDQDSNPPSNSDSSEDVVEPDTNVSEEMTNNGKLLLDATCAPADITSYSTDLGLLNEAREKLEHIIDVLHEPLKGSKQKPRTYRKKARKDYLTIAKQRKVGTRKMHKAVGK